jgi:hypothetical protein
MSEKWTEQQQAFIAWLALPKGERQPKTIAQFAKQSDIDERTLYRWKRLPGFAKAVTELARDMVKDDVPEVLATVRRKAIKGELVYVNMVLAMAGMATDIEDANRGGNTLNVVISYANDKPNPS